VPVLVADPNHAHLIRPRSLGLPTYYGDILSEAAEDSVELLNFTSILAVSDNDAYNTLVATDIGSELGRDMVWQVARPKEDLPRHALPTQLGGRPFGEGRTLDAFEAMLSDGWTFRVTRLTPEFTQADWRAKRPNAVALARVSDKGELRFVKSTDEMKVGANARIISLLPPGAIDSGPEAGPSIDGAA